MPQLPILDTLDAAPEGLRDYYVQHEADGKFYPDVPVETLPATEGLRNTLRKYKEHVPDANKLPELLQRLNAVKDVDPEEYRRLKEEAKSRPGAPDLEKIQKEHKAELEQVQTAAQKEILTAREETERERAAAREFYLDSVLTAAINAEDGWPHMIAHELRRFIQVERDGATGRFLHHVIGENGEKRIKDSVGNPFTLKDLVASYKAREEWGGAFKAAGTSGSGARPDNTGVKGGGKNPWSKEHWNLTEQGRLAREKPEEAKRLAAAAGYTLNL